MTNITDTKEVISALFRGLAEYKERAPEGLSKWEIGTLVMELAGPLKDATVGIQNVYTELLTIDEEARTELLQLIGDHLVQAGVTHRNTEISLSILNWILDGAQVAKFISEMPPTAEAA
jgi:hypothetical protein